MEHDDRYRICFHAIEKELDLRGLDWTIHGLPGADDIVHFQEYRLIHTPVSTKLFPAIVDAESASGLESMIVRAVEEHAANDDTTVYLVVLCGAGWTDDRVDALRHQVENRLKATIQLTIETLERFCRSRGSEDDTSVP